ncbi:unnamed protein product [Rotaria sordida]|uniref:Uncharacterized protein n=1 Tax=Rotaria sordida TaxID=392033 RepID=A0A813VTH9_9BILA|nr:unnamed protein product [Rotaria sordida]
MPANQSKRKRAIEVHNKKVTQRGNVPKSNKQTICEPLTAENLRSTYMKVPNLSLKEAIRRVPDFSTVLPSCVDSSIVSSSAKKGLTKEDAAAIRLYTIECPVYKLLNAALRTEELKNIEPWFPYLKLFNIAISKLTPKKGTYCRGINGNLNSLYPVGSIVTWVCKVIEELYLNE